MCRHPGQDFMAGHGVISRMQTPSQTPLQNYAGLATHRALAEQAFAVEEDDDFEEMFAMMDRSQWSGQGVSEPAIPPSLSQMFALTRRMGYEMRPIARRANQPPGSPRTPFASRQGYHPPFRQGRDFSKIKCFS